MTLIFGSIIGLACGWTLGRRRLSFVIVGLTWYVALATQTAYLAHAGRKGFFGVDGLAAVQGHRFAQYWLSQIPVLGLIVALFLLADKLRTRRHPSQPAPGTPP
jgi:Na+(H+)/acetate symporter ActP